MQSTINHNLKAASGITGQQILAFICCWLGGIFAGMDANLFSVMLPVTLPEIMHSTDRMIVSQAGSYILFSFLMGWMTGGFFLGLLGDRWGRVRSMAISISCYSLSAGLIGLSSELWQILLSRFVTGMGVGGVMVCIAVLLSETWPGRSRALAIGAGITSYQAGVFLSGFVAQLFSGWRLVFAVGTVPILLALVVQFCLRESQAWQDARAMGTSSTGSLRQHLKNIIQPGQRLNLLIGSTAFGALLIGYWASLSWVPTWIQDMVGNSNGSEKNVATMYHALAAMTGCLLAGVLANRWGRLPVIQFSFIGAFAASAWMFLTNDSFSSIIYLQHAGLGFFAGMAQAIMYIYLPELFPASIRATSVGFCLNCGRIITAILVLFVGVLVSFFGGYSETLFAFSCIYLIGAAAVCATPKALNVEEAMEM